MKCKKNYGYHDCELIDTCSAYQGSIDEKHKCKLCKVEYILRKLPNGHYLNDKDYTEAYAKDFLQPYHADYDKIYSNAKTLINQAYQSYKTNKELEDKKQELKDWKQSLKTTKVSI